MYVDSLKWNKVVQRQGFVSLSNKDNLLNKFLINIAINLIEEILETLSPSNIFYF